MAKRKGKRWLWGALLSAIILVAAICIVLSHSDTQSRIDRLTAYVVEEHGLRQRELRTFTFSATRTTIIMFEGEPHGEDAADEIVKMMRDSFPGWKYTAQLIPATDDESPSDDVPKCWEHSLQAGEAFEVDGWLIQYIPDDKGWSAPQHPIATMVVIGPSKVSLLEMIKGWLPW